MKRKTYTPDLCGQCWLSEIEVVPRATRVIEAPGMRIPVCDACFKSFVKSTQDWKREEAEVTEGTVTP